MEDINRQERLENILEENYELNVQFHKSMRESIFCFALAIYDEKLPFKEWEKKHYGNYIEQQEPKKENFFEELKKYFEVTPREKVLEDWAKSAEFDNIGPTVKEFIENTNKIKNENNSKTS